MTPGSLFPPITSGWMAQANRLAGCWLQSLQELLCSALPPSSCSLLLGALLRHCRYLIQGGSLSSVRNYPGCPTGAWEPTYQLWVCAVSAGDMVVCRVSNCRNSPPMWEKKKRREMFVYLSDFLARSASSHSSCPFFARKSHMIMLPPKLLYTNHLQLMIVITN